MKRIFLILPWGLVLAFGAALVLQNKEVRLPNLVVPYLLPESSPLSTSPSPLSASARVTRIVDGDTIDLSNGKRLRYVGIDTPETGDCLGSEATKKNKELVLDREVKLEKDVSEKDRYGRLLRFVWVGDTMINEEMVRSGYAKVYTYPPDIKYADRFVTAEREARENKRGLWADDACKVQGESTQGPNNQVTQLPSSSCNIKGNISTSGDKIYHLIGCGSYNKTTINESAGEHWFCSEDDAVSAGWRKAKNC